LKSEVGSRKAEGGNTEDEKVRGDKAEKLGSPAYKWRDDRSILIY
jgi:hypothetical protein